MSKLLTARDLGLVVGARRRKSVRVGATYPGAGSPGGGDSEWCKPPTPPPSWPPAGDCDGQQVQCRIPFTATATVSGGGTGTLTFDVSGGNFMEFVPVDLCIVATQAAATETNPIRGLRLTSISYLGNQYNLDSNGVPAVFFDLSTAQDGRISMLPLPKRLYVNGADVTITVANDDSTDAALVRASLVGYALRPSL